MRILIVDNNVELCQVLEEYLNCQSDLEVVGLAHDGEQALVQVESLEPDVMLLDITMPYLDGLGVLERLRTRSVKKKPKVVVMTAFGNDSLISRLTYLGADYFMIKPFRLEILAERVRQFSTDNHAIATAEMAVSADTTLTNSQRVTKLLHSMGVPPHFKGFSYLKEAVLMWMQDDYLGGGLSKEMYPALAKKYDTTVSGVEAAIRNAVVAAWEHGNTEFIKKLCGPHATDRMPTNSLIIAKIAEGSQVF